MHLMILLGPLGLFLLFAILIVVRTTLVYNCHSRALNFVSNASHRWRIVHPVSLEHRHADGKPCYLGWMQFYEILKEPRYSFERQVFGRWFTWTYNGFYGELETRIETILMMENLTN